jgi:hypothetical protein
MKRLKTVLVFIKVYSFNRNVWGNSRIDSLLKAIEDYELTKERYYA